MTGAEWRLLTVAVIALVMGAVAAAPFRRTVAGPVIYAVMVAVVVGSAAWLGILPL